MGDVHHPRHGSLQFWPRARSRKHAARVRAWPTVKENKLLGFIGYKVGMTHLLVKEENPNSPRKNLDVFTPVTIIECPPLKVCSVRYYTTDEDDDLKLTSEVFAKKTEKELARKTRPAKAEHQAPEQFDMVKVAVYTQPKLTGIGKKKPDVVEIAVGGKNLQEQSSFALSLLDKPIKVSEVFHDAQFVDVHAVTKGHGFSGVNKKFGVKRLQHKSEKGTSGIGTLGPWHPNKVRFSVAQAGKFGYHLRTEYNKICVKVGTSPEKINPKGGFVHYGVVKNDYLLIKGSVPGAVKRPITVITALRPKEKMYNQTVNYTSLESKQR